MNVEEYPDAGEGEFSVGFGDAPIETIRENIEIVNQSVSDARQSLDAFRAGILEEIDAVICECRNSFGECVSCVTGSVDLATDSARNMLNGLRQRVLNEIDNATGFAGSHLLNVMQQLPAPFDVATSTPGDIAPPKESAGPMDFSFLRNAGNAYQDYVLASREPGGATLDDSVVPAFPAAIVVDTPDTPDTPPGDTGGTTTTVGGGGGGACNTCPAGWTLGTKLDPNSGESYPWCFNPLGGPGKAPDCQPPTKCDLVDGIEVCPPVCSPTTPDDPSGGGSGSGGTGKTFETCESGLGDCETNCTTLGGTWEADPSNNSGSCVSVPGSTIRQLFDCKLPAGTPPNCFADYSAAKAFVEANSVPGKEWIITDSGTFVIGPGGNKFPITPDCGADKACSDCPPKDLTDKGVPPAPVVDPSRSFTVCNPNSWDGFADSVITGEQFNTQVESAYRRALWEYMRGVFKDASSGSIIGRSLVWVIAFMIGPFIGLIGVFAELYSRFYPGLSDCDNEKNRDVRRKTVLAGSIGKWFGIVDKPAFKQLEYEGNFFCQTEIPSVSEINSARRVGVLTEDEWKFGLKLNGACLPWYEKVYDLSKPLVPIHAVIGWNRAKLETDEQLRTRLKRYGIQEETDVLDFTYASEQLPGASDLVRFMTRDAGDESTVEEFGYDDQFEEKFTDKIKEWAGRINLPEEVLRYHWRSHWKIPSNSELFSMLHRLRPEKNMLGEDGQPLAVEYETVLNALKINDVAPRFAQRLAEISYRLPGIRQIAKAYETGAIDADKALSMYQDLGYDKESANVLLSYLKVESAERKAKIQGTIGPNEVEKAYRVGAVGRDQFVEALTNAGIPPDIAMNRVNAADTRNMIADRSAVVKGLHRWYMTGGGNDQEYLQKLIAAGVDQPRATELVARDRSIKFSKNKAVTLSALCKLVGQGYLSLQEYTDRAQNLGYDQLDALLLASSCNADHVERLNAKLAADQRRAVADAEKAERKAKKFKSDQRKAYLERLPCSPKGKPKCLGPVVIPGEEIPNVVA